MAMRRGPLGTWALALPLAWLPSLARACPVCFAAQDEAQRIALLGTTVFLTALPLLLIGGVIFWLATRSAQDDRPEPPRVEPSESAAAPVPSAPEATGSFGTR